MYKKFAVFCIIVAGGIGLTQTDIFGSAWEKLKQMPTAQLLKTSVQSSELLPGPLRGEFDPNNTLLTVQGTIDATNQQREVYSLSPLHRSEKLNRAAQAKLDDMFDQQYFEHNSPQGVTPADVIKKAGYEYIVVGENLALGNFKNDQLLVEAWMNSPGHRANILHPTFQEIGVAVGKGMFEGREVWLAVQEFGVPLSNCSQPASSIQQQISLNRKQIEIMQQDLARRKQQLDSERYRTQQEYNQAVEEYNALANRTNKLIDETRILAEKYNDQVRAFNECLEKNV